MNTKTISKILFIIIIGIVFAFSFNHNQVYAADNSWIDSPLDTIKSAVPSTSTPDVTINKIVNLIFTISEVAFVVILIVGGVMYLTSMGNEDAAGKARKLMLDAVIGIVIVLSAWGIGTWLLSSLKGNSGASSNTNSSAGTGAIISNATSSALNAATKTKAK